MCEVKENTNYDDYASAAIADDGDNAGGEYCAAIEDNQAED